MPVASNAVITPTSLPVVDPSQQDESWVTASVAITVGGLDRRYLVVRPRTPTGPLPVLVVLHGRWVDPEVEVQRTDFAAVTGPAILVFPAGFGQSWNAGACCGAAHDADVDDVGFVTAVIQQVLAEQPGAAPDHVYLAGYSNGGKLAYLLACSEPELFAGVAAVGAVPVASCASTTAVPFIVVSNRGDPELSQSDADPPQSVNGFTMPSVAATVDQLRVRNGCSATSAAATSGRATTTTFAGCASADPVVGAVYDADNHDWPAGDAQTPAAASLIWNFLLST
jgi:polyhydroxybutyrate depolymerase